MIHESSIIFNFKYLIFINQLLLDTFIITIYFCISSFDKYKIEPNWLVRFSLISSIFLLKSVNNLEF